MRRHCNPLRWLLIAALGIAGIDLGLWWLSDIEWYVGLSGLLNTLAAAGIVREIVDGDRMAWLIGALGLAKLVSENLSGPMPFMQPGIPVVLDAHLYGALVGMVCGLAMRRSAPAHSPAESAKAEKARARRAPDRPREFPAAPVRRSRAAAGSTTCRRCPERRRARRMQPTTSTRPASSSPWTNARRCASSSTRRSASGGTTRARRRV